MSMLLNMTSIRSIALRWNHFALNYNSATIIHVATELAQESMIVTILPTIQ